MAPDSGICLPRTIVEDHPGRAEPVPEHGESECEKGLLHRHEDLAAIGEQGEETLRLFDAVNAQRQVDAAHGLKAVRWYVVPHELRLSDVHASVEDCLLPVRWNVARVRLLAVSHHRCDLSAQMLLVKTERLLAVAAVIDI